jgi:ubiquinone/menaquinone biosynthesis C-methylase UbiE
MSMPGNDQVENGGGPAGGVAPTGGGAPAGGEGPAGGWARADGGADWVRWHRAYEDPDSALSARLRAVQAAVRAALDRQPPGPIRIVSICAGQGRDVIDVVAEHPRRADVRALLVELDPGLVAFARDRAEAAGVGDVIDVVEGDASRVGSYAGAFPADLLLICGVFGNISNEDIRSVIDMMPSFCAPGGTVIWTRHRRPPDLTAAVREWFAQAGFTEESYVAPEPYVLSVGSHRLARELAAGGAAVSGAAVGEAVVGEFDPDARLFDFVGNGSLPA